MNFNKTIELTTEDYFKFCKIAFKRFETKKEQSFIKFLLVWTVIGIVFGVLWRFVFENTITSILTSLHWPTASLFIAIFVMFFLVFLYFLKQSQNRFIPIKDGVILCSKEFEINETGIHEKTKFGETFTNWFALLDVVVDSGDVYLFLDRMYAYIIPTRCFSNNEEREQLVEFLQKNV